MRKYFGALLALLACASCLCSCNNDDTYADQKKRERKVISLRFGLADGHPRTLEEVGREFGVTRERIRQIEAKAIRKLHSRKCLSLLNGLIE